jgi:hypothetical protein
MSRPTFLLLILIALALAPPMARAGDALVLESTEASLPRGSVVKDGAAVEVAAGANVTLIGQDGSTVTVEGPHSGPIGAPAGDGSDDLVGGLALLFGEGGTDASSFGAVRGLSDGTGEVWTIDLSVSGRRCVEPAGTIALRRGAAGSGQFRAIASGAEVPLAFADEAAVQPWPATVPVVDGADYGFIPDGSGSLVHIVVQTVPSALPTTAHVASWLARQGCGPQALALLDQLAEPPEGELTLALSTTRGPAPILKVGEALEVTIATSDDAWVHCLYASADGTVVGFFPNSFTGGPRLAGRVTHRVPRADDGLRLVMSPPAGHEAIRCYAWREDPAGRLPAEVAGADITAAVPGSLDELVARIEGDAAPEAAASLDIQISE